MNCRMLCGLLLGAALAACGDNGTTVPDAPVVVVIDAAVDAPVVAATLTTFVIDQIKNNTSDMALPVAFATFATLPDPDGDANNNAAYASLFQ